MNIMIYVKQLWNNVYCENTNKQIKLKKKNYCLLLKNIFFFFDILAMLSTGL